MIIPKDVKMGRPATDIDGDTVRKLAKLGCTQNEIADFFGVSQSVISERFHVPSRAYGSSGHPAAWPQR
jgi:hypothetical protein